MNSEKHEHSFLEKFLSETVEAPAACKKAFELHFDGAARAEWHRREKLYEVLFHLDSREHLAHFSPSGALLTLHTNLGLNELPETIKSGLKPGFELMNLVKITSGHQVTYEVIVRNRELQRFVWILDDTGEIREERRL